MITQAIQHVLNAGIPALTPVVNAPEDRTIQLTRDELKSLFDADFLAANAANRIELKS